MKSDPVKSAIAIVTFGEKFLAIQRDGKTERDPFRWVIGVGGFSNENESFDETIARESVEEITIFPKHRVRIGTVKMRKNSLSNDMAIYWIRLTPEEKKKVRLGDEGLELGFFSMDELKKMDLTTELKWYFSKFEKGIERIAKEGIIDKSALGFDKRGVLVMS